MAPGPTTMVPVRSRPRVLDVVRLVVTGLCLTLALSIWPVLGPTSVASAQDEGTTNSEPPDSPDFIPEPNSGSEPVDAGDRGGSLQSVLFVLVIAGIVVIAALIVRESRRARARRGF